MGYLARQAHGCGTGDRAELLRGKAPELVKLYRSMEKALKTHRDVEIVMRGRYALFRTTRIFAADLLRFLQAAGHAPQLIPVSEEGAETEA